MPTSFLRLCHGVCYPFEASARLNNATRTKVRYNFACPRVQKPTTTTSCSRDTPFLARYESHGRCVMKLATCEIAFAMKFVRLSPRYQADPAPVNKFPFVNIRTTDLNYFCLLGGGKKWGNATYCSSVVIRGDSIMSNR